MDAEADEHPLSRQEQQDRLVSIQPGARALPAPDHMDLFPEQRGTLSETEYSEDLEVSSDGDYGETSMTPMPAKEDRFASKQVCQTLS